MPAGRGRARIPVVGAAGFTLAPAGITAAGAATTEGTARADRLTGTAHDLVRGRAGGDLVRGRSGEDHVSGGRGDDVVHLGPGGVEYGRSNRVDQAHGGLGDDRLSGGADRTRCGVGRGPSGRGGPQVTLAPLTPPAR